MCVCVSITCRVMVLDFGFTEHVQTVGKSCRAQSLKQFVRPCLKYEPTESLLKTLRRDALKQEEGTEEDTTKAMFALKNEAEKHGHKFEV